MKIFTIGFTKKSAQEFFTLLSHAGVKTLVDARLNPDSQLSGFAKRRDLPYFLRALGNIDYTHTDLLAPTKSLLQRYRKHDNDWDLYVRDFNELIRQRRIESRFTPEQMDHACLLCSEHTADRCHRRLVAEYFSQHWNNVDIHHL